MCATITAAANKGKVSKAFAEAPSARAPQPSSCACCARGSRLSSCPNWSMRAFTAALDQT
jgi:hypothetical protein